MLNALQMILFFIVNNIIGSANLFNGDLSKINEWALQWKMTFNADPRKQAQKVIFSCKISKSNHFEDTDVFVLLCHSYHIKQWKAELFMEGFKEGKNVISIKDSVKKHIDIIPQIMYMHTLTGCDSVPMMYGVGKKKVLSIMKKSPFSHLGEQTANENDFINECKNFAAACYNGKSISSTDNRQLFLF